MALTQRQLETQRAWRARNPDKVKAATKRASTKLAANLIKWRAANPHKTKEYNDKYCITNKESRRASAKRSYQKYSSKYAEWNKKWRETHDRSEYNREFGKKRRANPEFKAKRNKQANERYDNDPKFQMIVTLRSRFYRALKKSLGGRSENGAMDLLGCTMDFFMDYISKQFTPGMTWSTYGSKGWHLDHRKPIAAFLDLSDPEQQKECFHYTNFQPLWALDNLKKGSKLIYFPSNDGAKTEQKPSACKASATGN